MEAPAPAPPPWTAPEPWEPVQYKGTVQKGRERRGHTGSSYTRLRLFFATETIGFVFDVGFGKVHDAHWSDRSALAPWFLWGWRSRGSATVLSGHMQRIPRWKLALGDWLRPGCAPPHRAKATRPLSRDPPARGRASFILTSFDPFKNKLCGCTLSRRHYLPNPSLLRKRPPHNSKVISSRMHTKYLHSLNKEEKVWT